MGEHGGGSSGFVTRRQTYTLLQQVEQQGQQNTQLLQQAIQVLGQVTGTLGQVTGTLEAVNGKVGQIMTAERGDPGRPAEDVPAADGSSG